MVKENARGVVLCLVLALVGQWLGGLLPLVGGPVFALLIGMSLHSYISRKNAFQPGLTFTSKKILQYAVICLGFGLNLSAVLAVGRQSLPIILSTISIALFLAFLMWKWLPISSHLATLIGVGTSICGGSAIAATAPIIQADDEDVAQAFSVIFLFNVLAALVFPTLATWLGFSTDSGQAFGMFAGTAVNDTSSVTATAATWDSLYALGSQTLDTAVMVKLTRTLAIIPITTVLAIWRSRGKGEQADKKSLLAVFPTFILYFILASLVTTIAGHFGLGVDIFTPLKTLSKFLICMAMAAIGLRTNVLALVKNGRAALFVGLVCWLGVTVLTLVWQAILGIW
ncbi:TPA: putative sulfate exporter family transporter [Streptococcus suis]|uniref:YeiH family protein n=1 Tax=Streptococcus suis TaxID=1307 RepID=UPI001ABE5362|nr:putative sulfate exporter family transporter [Streptococcus suis]MBO4109559.1 putative sulfate exporter family transporter [Streptococcus suis]HEM3613656.1 putative sulfate exporter family transporter [Streptococcus suis]HEM3621625.1 putative sulfate exporter family transporter [Streptococcus suis]HEM3623533.1 putative sulfate exporter family transporter [Streptococcus suis]HEM3630609.1 putative sulfate exporter family transporter [Streptococcus suis]